MTLKHRGRFLNWVFGTTASRTYASWQSGTCRIVVLAFFCFNKKKELFCQNDNDPYRQQLEPTANIKRVEVDDGLPEENLNSL